MRNDLIIFEDDHLLVINKPAGMNTHSPSPYAGEGIYEWLKNREPRWANLAIIHRLDKETSGLLVFGKTTLANKSLTDQFSGRAIHKKYVLLTDQKVTFKEFTAKSSIVRAGEKYVSYPQHPAGEVAETRFRNLGIAEESVGKVARLFSIEAEPVTGRTHQIRVHAAANGFAIFGDSLYGGARAERVFLHAKDISFVHPSTGAALTFTAPAGFSLDSRLLLRSRVVDPNETDAFRLIHGASDGWPRLYVDKLGDFILAQAEHEISEIQSAKLKTSCQESRAGGIYFKKLNRHVRGASIEQTSPQHSFGKSAADDIRIRENGVWYLLSFNEGYSVGLFLDQRDNRRRFLTGYVAPHFFLSEKSPSGDEKPNAILSGLTVLNTFAYTCGFSVCAAKAGARVTSLDLSKKYLEWGKRNFAVNNLNPADHDFIFGDTFDWLRRLAKKGRSFDVVILDPPTFSQSKEQGVFRVEKDYGKLVQAALGVLKSNGVLLCSTNAAELKPEKFMEMVATGVQAVGRKIAQQQYIPQPPDFPVSRDEPAYLKTTWIRVA